MELKNGCSSLLEDSEAPSCDSGVGQDIASENNGQDPEDPSDFEQVTLPQDDVRVEAQSTHRPFRYLKSTITISYLPKPSSVALMNEKPASQSSRLLCLPLELQQLIYGNLDTKSLLCLSLSSRAARSCVEAVPEWRHLSGHCPEMLAAMSQMKLLRRHTVVQLDKGFRFPRCMGCPTLKYGAYIFLPTVERCCWVCLSYNPLFRVISLVKASRIFAISIRRIFLDLYIFQSIPGTYDEGNQTSMAPRLLVCVRDAVELGLRVYGSVKMLKAAADVSCCYESPFETQERTYLQSAATCTLGIDDPCAIKRERQLC